MILLKTDLWESTAPLKLVTTNSTLKYNGHVVMGRGAALEAKHRYPAFPKRLGDIVKSQGYVYGVAIWDDLPVGAFQVKHNWWEAADLDLISTSVDVLKQMIRDSIIPHQRVAMNFPGIGNGKLDRKLVWPLIRQLPDVVEVHEL